ISATRQRPPLSRRLLATVSKDRTLARRLRGRRRVEPTVHHLSPRGLHVSGEPGCARRLSERPTVRPPRWRDKELNRGPVAHDHPHARRHVIAPYWSCLLYTSPSPRD